MRKLSLVLLLAAATVFFGCSGKDSGPGKNKKVALRSAVINKDDTFKDFIFVGMINGNPGLYLYDYAAKKSTPFWSDRDEKVVDFSYSADQKAAFFLTARNYGKRGVFPFVDGLKLYLFNADSSKVTLIKKIGSGLQVFTSWGPDGTFKVVLNSFDDIVANYINQKTQIFNTFGKELVDEKRTYDITKDAYPKPPENNTDLDSPGGKYAVDTAASGKTFIYLKESGRKSNILVAITPLKLNQVEWTADSKYLIISTLDITPNNETLYSKDPNTSGIIIYSLKEKKIAARWEGGGVKNFILINNFIIFDDGFKDKASIKIFNYKEGRMVDTIRIDGGCGIRNIPLIPDYSA